MVLLTLKCEKGLLQERKEDAVVNSTNQVLDLQMNASARALASAAGPELQKECRRLSPLKKGKVKVSKAYKLQCKTVLHCWVDCEKDLEKAIMKCLTVADKKLKYKSIAFPALGTGVLQFPAEDVARYFIRCIHKHSSENLSDVYVVILPDDEHIYEKFLMVFKQHNELNWSPTQHFMDGLKGSLITDHLLTLFMDSKEYMQVEDNFRKTIPLSKVKIIEIKRVQNFTQWVKYQEHRRHVSMRLKKSEQEVEKTLWHGTTEKAAQKIALKFFNRSYAGQNATVYGRGTYFARDASYSDDDTYSKPNSEGEKYIFQARVVVGEFTEGHGDLIEEPETDSGEPCDSAVDDVEDPLLFVVFQDAAAYPEYIIKYTKVSESDNDSNGGSDDDFDINIDGDSGDCFAGNYIDEDSGDHFSGNNTDEDSSDGLSVNNTDGGSFCFAGKIIDEDSGDNFSGNKTDEDSGDGFSVSNIDGDFGYRFPATNTYGDSSACFAGNNIDEDSGDHFSGNNTDEDSGDGFSFNNTDGDSGYSFSGYRSIRASIDSDKKSCTIL